VIDVQLEKEHAGIYAFVDQIRMYRTHAVRFVIEERHQQDLHESLLAGSRKPMPFRERETDHKAADAVSACLTERTSLCAEPNEGHRNTAIPTPQGTYRPVNVQISSCFTLGQSKLRAGVPEQKHDT
jgi:hypothetical protein